MEKPVAIEVDFLGQFASGKTAFLRFIRDKLVEAGIEVEIEQANGDFDFNRAAWFQDQCFDALKERKTKIKLREKTIHGEFKPTTTETK